jgi:hypothetical protein
MKLTEHIKIGRKLCVYLIEIINTYYFIERYVRMNKF